MNRFGIRDLLWLMGVAGLGTALWIKHREAATLRNERDILQVAVTDAGFEVEQCWKGWQLIDAE
jgi:hypothetical protein